MTRRICIISGTFPPVHCGIGDYTARLMEGLVDAVNQGQDKNFEFTVLTSNQAQPKDGQNYRLVGLVERWDWPTFRQVLGWLNRNRPDVVHIEYPTALYGRHPAITLLPFFIWLQALVRRFPAPARVLTIHEYQTFRILGKTRIWLMALFSNGIIGVSRETLYSLRFLKLLGKKLEYIPLSTNIGSSTPPEYQQNPKIWRQAQGIATNGPVIAYFGFVSPAKGLHTLIEAFAKLDPPAQLLLITEPKAQDASYQNYYNQIDALLQIHNLQNSVKWTGFVDDMAVAACLQSATLVVLPFSDGVSLRRTSLQAALANAAPVITTHPAYPLEGEGLVSGENIWLVPAENPQALAEALKTLLANETLRQRLAENGQKFAQQFSWPAIAQQHLELYGQVLSSKNFQH